MLLRRQRTHLGVRVQRIADADRRSQRHEALEERVCDTLVQDQTRTCDASLPLVAEDRPRGAVDRGVEVRIVEYDVRALAAQLQLQALQVALRCVDDPAARRGRTGERDLADPGVFGEPLAGGVSIAGHDIDDAGRKSDLGHQLDDPQRRQRRDLRRFQHDRVAGGQRRAHLPAREHQREIPRHDLPDYADRRALHIVEEARFDRNHRALQLVGHPAEVAKARCRARHVERPGIADRVSGIQRFELGEFLGIRLDRIRQTQQQPAALGRRQRRPFRKRARRGFDRRVHVRGGGGGDFRDQRAVVRIEHVDRAAVDGVDEAPVDEELGLHESSSIGCASAA
ncbi:hypothetical protein FEP92_01500 [Burkholderia multivorans]|nr:hypothetical protein [Burkholderia multivorans]